MKRFLLRRGLDAAALLLGLLLFWLFARQVNWTDSLALLRRVGPNPFLFYVAINCGIAFLFANRWWLLLRGMGVRLSFGRVAIYRMVGATASLLTPAPSSAASLPRSGCWCVGPVWLHPRPSPRSRWTGCWN